MLRDAALATLAIMDRALGAGFVLKDATGFNILFDGVVPKLVDVPSIEPYVDGRVWAAYGQFCRSFLFPLLLAAYRDVDVQALLRGTLGEVPVGFAANLLSLRDYSRPGVFKDVILQARLERTFGKSTTAVKRETSAGSYPKALLVASVRRLRTLVEGLKRPGSPSEWSAYESDCNYSDADRAEKRSFVTRALGARRARARRRPRLQYRHVQSACAHVRRARRRPRFGFKGHRSSVSRGPPRGDAFARRCKSPQSDAGHGLGAPGATVPARAPAVERLPRARVDSPPADHGRRAACCDRPAAFCDRA